MALVWFPTPSSNGPLLTLTPVEATSQTLGALLGLAKMASERSLPTLRSSTSKAATTWMSLGLKPAKTGLRSPKQSSVSQVFHSIGCLE